MTLHPAPEGAPRFLSDVIIEHRFADESCVNRAVEDARASGTTVGQILVRAGHISDDDLARALAARYGLCHVDLAEFEVDSDAANLLPPESAARYKAVPLVFEPHGELLVAMADPSDSLALNDIAVMTHREVHVAVAAESMIARLAAQLPLPPTQRDDSRVASSESATRVASSESATESDEPAEASRAGADAVQSDSPDARLNGHTEDDTALKAEVTGSEYRAELERLQAELEAVRAELEAVRTELEAVRTELEVAHAGREADQTELEAVRAQRDMAHAQLEDALSGRHDAGEHQAELERLRGEFGQLQAELAASQARLETLGSERDGACAELTRVRDEHRVAQDELQAVRRDRDDLVARVEAGRADLDAAHTELDLVRSQLGGVHAEVEAARSEREAAVGELEAAQAELHATRQGFDAARSERDSARSERDAARSELEAARSERDAARSELAEARSDWEAGRAERDGAREELEKMRRERDTAQADLEQAIADAAQQREAAETAERRLGEMGDLEQRIVEAHSVVAKMRTDFELEREGHAATERELRAQLASKTEQHQALADECRALQERADALDRQNSSLREAYTTAKRLSADLVSTGHGLAAALDEAVIADGPPEQLSNRDQGGQATDEMLAEDAVSGH